MDVERNPEEQRVSGAGAAYRRGIIVAVVLAVLTVVEYFIGTGEILNGSLIVLAVIALVKAGLIVQYFMHISRLWTDEEEAH
jgi:cytochrome c oxidase subunit 4